MNSRKFMRIVISGGGTGGHVFPAIAIAHAIKEEHPGADLLFVGAQGRIEMEKVPQAGYRIEALPIRGMPRKFSLKMLVFLRDLFRSMLKARKIVKRFKPNLVVGVGGYASGPIGRVAALHGIPLVIQEQNSYAGITNKLLARHASKICVAYDYMDRYFPAGKIIKTGNPIRQDLLNLQVDKLAAREYFKLQAPYSKVILVLGGSGGARQMNQSILNHLETIRENSDVAILWQTGKNYYTEAREQAHEAGLPNLKVFDFITRMDYAFALADLVITRSGAGTISELGVIGKPALFVPSPNVAEDHQTHNAMALVEKGAAEIVHDKDAPEKLIIQALTLVSDDNKLQKMANNMKQFGIPDAAKVIAREAVQLIH